MTPLALPARIPFTMLGSVRLVKYPVVAVSAVELAYGNVLAIEVEVAMKNEAVGVEVEVTVPELLTHRSELAMPASESAPVLSIVVVALPPKYAF